MQHPLRARIIPALSLVALLLLPSGAKAGSVGKEFWVGGGAGWPEDNSKAGANIRGGAQLIFARHFTLGVSGQADRERYYYFADSSIIFPPLGMVEPYGRFQVGRRDDVDDTAMGWAAGLRMGEDSIRVFAEGYGIFEPAGNYGVCVGISF
jgi:hypothetical protein